MMLSHIHSAIEFWFDLSIPKAYQGEETVFTLFEFDESLNSKPEEWVDKAIQYFIEASKLIEQRDPDIKVVLYLQLSDTSKRTMPGVSTLQEIKDNLSYLHPPELFLRTKTTAHTGRTKYNTDITDLVELPEIPFPTHIGYTQYLQTTGRYQRYIRIEKR